MDETDEEIAARVRQLVAAAVRRLAEAEVRDEALAHYVGPRRVLLIPRQSTMEPIARVWRLGMLLLTRDGRLFATGSITRVAPPGRAAYQSQSAEIRREYRAAAGRGPFAPGDTVNYDATPIGLDAASLRAAVGPLFLRGAQPVVRWSPLAPDEGAIPFTAYLDERVDLLLHPPQGA